MSRPALKSGNVSRPPSRIRAMPPPPARRGTSTLRANSVTPSLNGRAASPADSMASSRIKSPNGSIAGSIAGSKRKEREFDHEPYYGETNINVFVRCRGRNEREVKENSGVVITTDGVKGKTVEISMGQNALSNKTYTFDKVFSPAADQTMIFDEVVTPILDEVGELKSINVVEADSIPGSPRLQLHNLRIRANGYW